MTRSLTFLSGAVVLAACALLSAQSAPLPGIADALRLQQKDPAAAATILEGVTAREPQNARAWRLLGSARQQAKQFDASVEAYLKALSLGPDPISTYNLAVVHAMKGDVDRAFEWLAKAKSARADMTAAAVDPNLTGLRKDPRFALVLPGPADFKNPFVEPTTILHEWVGEAANDQFGWVARTIGDVDKDGVLDFATSAPTHATGGQAAGRIYVYSTRSRRLLWKADGAAGDRLGITIEAAGDTNKDGVPDVVATGGGHVRIYSGSDGAALRVLKSPGPLPLVSTAGAGDVNGDGYADVIAGATPLPPGAGATAPPASSPGAAYVFSGKDGSVLMPMTGERDGDRFGSAVAGDALGKGVLLVVGAPGAGGSRTGRAYAYKDLGGKAAFTIDADESGAALGAMFVAVVGDVDADGVPDAYASDFANRAKGPSTGRVYVHSGKDGRRLLTLTGETPGEGFGTSPSPAGDLDNDGHADLAVGAWQYAAVAVSGGRIYVHSGRDGRLLRTITCRIPGDTLGFDSVGIGDVDGDGVVDLLVTSAYSGINGYHSGRVFVVSSGVRRQR
jgi:hypothetical protein